MPYPFNGRVPWIRSRRTKVADGQALEPDWQPGRGERAWIFVDEIVIE